MNQVSLRIALCCQNKEEKETTLSKGLRITAIVIGLIAIIVGALILFKVSGLHQLGTTAGWVTPSLGGGLCLVAFSIKCIKQQTNKASSVSSHESRTSSPLSHEPTDLAMSLEQAILQAYSYKQVPANMARLLKAARDSKKTHLKYTHIIIHTYHELGARNVNLFGFDGMYSECYEAMKKNDSIVILIAGNKQDYERLQNVKFFGGKYDGPIKILPPYGSFNDFSSATEKKIIELIAE